MTNKLNSANIYNIKILIKHYNFKYFIKKSEYILGSNIISKDY